MGRAVPSRHSALSIILLLFSPALSDAVDVLVFGDSWGTYGKEAFGDMFTKHGSSFQVENRAVGGTTAASWAEDPQSLVSLLDEFPETRFIWLTIGGNDGIYELLDGVRPMEVIAQEAQRNILTFLEPAIKAYPHIKIVQFGYDIVDFSGLVCGGLSLAMLPECLNRKSCVNDAVQVLQLTVDLTCEANPVQHTCLNLRGTMQEVSGEIPGPFPNEDYYSPSSLMEDCIHPAYDGFQMIFDRMWSEYWIKQPEVKHSISHGNRVQLSNSSQTLSITEKKMARKANADKRLVDNILARRNL